MERNTAHEMTLLVSADNLPIPGAKPRLGVAASIEQQLEQLERAQIGRPFDQRLQAQIVALSDPGVRSLLRSKLEEGLIFRGVVCVPAPNIPEHRHVLFRFEPAPGGFCVVPPSFLVVVDIVQELALSRLDAYSEQLPVDRRMDDCESSEATGKLGMRVLGRDGEALRVQVEVRAEVKVGWPVSDSVCFELHQEVRLHPGGRVKLVETESGAAEVRLEAGGELVLTATLSKWGMTKEWEKTLLVG